MYHIANQGLLNKVPVNYSNYPLAIYVLSTQNSKVHSLVDYLNLDKIQITIDQQLIHKYTNSNNNVDNIIASKVDYLFNNSLLNNYNLAIIGVDNHGQLQEQITKLRSAYYFVIIYFMDIEEQLDIDISKYRELFSMSHELHYLRLLDNNQLKLILSKYGSNQCYYQNNLDQRTLQLIELINAK